MFRRRRTKYFFILVCILSNKKAQRSKGLHKRVPCALSFETRRSRFLPTYYICSRKKTSFFTSLSSFCSLYLFRESSQIETSPLFCEWQRSHGRPVSYVDAVRFFIFSFDFFFPFDSSRSFTRKCVLSLMHSVVEITLIFLKFNKISYGLLHY